MDSSITAGDRRPRDSSCLVESHCTAPREKPSHWVLTDGAAQTPALLLQNERTRPVESGDVRGNVASRGSDDGFTCKYLVFVTAV